MKTIIRRVSKMTMMTKMLKTTPQPALLLADSSPPMVHDAVNLFFGTAPSQTMHQSHHDHPCPRSGLPCGLR